jgi:hypothetical protein
MSAVFEIIKLKRPSGNLLLYGLLFAQAFLWVFYGYITSRTPIFLINTLYSIVTALYLFSYFIFTSDRKVRLCLSSATIGLLLFTVSCLVVPDRDLQVFILGSSATIVGSLLSFAPLKEVADVIVRGQTLTPDYPIGLALTGLLGSCMWGICAIFMRSLPYLISNVVSLALCALQVAVYLIYASSASPRFKSSPLLTDHGLQGN